MHKPYRWLNVMTVRVFHGSPTMIKIGNGKSILTYLDCELHLRVCNFDRSKQSFCTGCKLHMNARVSRALFAADLTRMLEQPSGKSAISKSLAEPRRHHEMHPFL